MAPSDHRRAQRRLAPRTEIEQPPLFPRASDVLAGAPLRALEPLVSAATRERLIACARECSLPAQTACYEVRLREGDERVDLALCLLPGFGFPEEHALAELEARYGDRPGWVRTLDFLEQWTAPGAPLLPQIPFVWLAFDLEGERTRLPDPCVGVCVDAEFFRHRLTRGLESERRQPRTLSTLLESCWSALMGSACPAALTRQVAHCLADRRARAKHFSFMLGREPATFKLDVQLAADAVPDYLRALDWPGASARVDSALSAGSTLATLLSGSRDAQLNLVLHPERDPLVELELLTGPRDGSASSRAALLEQLVSRDLCSPAKATALAALSARPVRPISEGGREVCLAMSWYVKVRFREDTPIEAKAYLGLMPRLNFEFLTQHSRRSGS